jgi:hypothetical protein
MLYHYHIISLARKLLLKHITKQCARSLSNVIKCDMDLSHHFHTTDYFRPL